MLTQEEKMEQIGKVIKRLTAILTKNGLSWEDLDYKITASFIMIYQEGLKDGKDLLKSP